MILLVTAIFGAVGIYVGDWPPIEYGLALALLVVQVGLVQPIGFRFLVALPGAFVGYLWGGVLASRLDRSNVAHFSDSKGDDHLET